MDGGTPRKSEVNLTSMEFHRPNSSSIATAQRGQRRMVMAVLLLCYFIVCLASLLFSLHYATHRIAYDPQQFRYALGTIILFYAAALPFLFARFSFGYFVGFFLFTTTLGFIWLSWFTSFEYDYQAARISAAASIIAFLTPVLSLSLSFSSRIQLSCSQFKRLLDALLIVSIVTIAIGASYNFRPVGLNSIQDFRPSLKFPASIGYPIGIVSSAVLPFLFAIFVVQGRIWRVGLTLMLLVLLYPITLTKMAFFAPIWLLGLAILSRFVEMRVTVILSLLLPLLFGVIFLALFQEHARTYFDVVNFRMVTVPSSALNVYNDFFAHHQPTHFCQVSFLNKLLGCLESEPLFVTMERTYGLGFFNASLLATEGVASAGVKFAPITVFACGLVIAIGNCCSHGLPPRLVLLSSAMLTQYILNVPLTTAMLTHGACLLFLLWYLTPRTFFEGRRHADQEMEE
jgi:hypothetical protein